MRQLRQPLAIAALAAALLAPTPSAQAAPLPFTATLSLQLSDLPPVVTTASGIGDSSGPGGAASLPAGAFQTNFVAVLSPRLVVFDILALGGTPLGVAISTGMFPLVQVTPPTHTPLVGSNFNWNGATGTLFLNGSAFLGLRQYTNTPSGAISYFNSALLGIAIPLGLTTTTHATGSTSNAFRIGPGVGGTINAGGLIQKVYGNPFQLGVVTQMGSVLGSPVTLTATGYDNRTPSGMGVLQVVSPTLATISIGGGAPVMSVLRINFVPEPGTGLLLGAGVLGLAALGRRRR